MALNSGRWAPNPPRRTGGAVRSCWSRCCWPCWRCASCSAPCSAATTSRTASPAARRRARRRAAPSAGPSAAPSPVPDPRAVRGVGAAGRPPATDGGDLPGAARRRRLELSVATPARRRASATSGRPRWSCGSSPATTASGPATTAQPGRPGPSRRRSSPGTAGKCTSLSLVGPTPLAARTARAPERRTAPGSGHLPRSSRLGVGRTPARRAARRRASASEALRSVARGRAAAGSAMAGLREAFAGGATAAAAAPAARSGSGGAGTARRPHPRQQRVVVGEDEAPAARAARPCHDAGRWRRRRAWWPSSTR